MAGLWAALVGAALGGAPEPADAAEPASWVELSWDAPDSCPDAGQVHARIGDYLGQPPEQRPDVRASARVEQTDDGFALSLRTETASGVTIRETVDERCEVLVDATALIVAIAIDPSVVMNRPAVPPPAEPEPPPEPTVEPEPQPQPDEPPVEDEPAPLLSPPPPVPEPALRQPPRIRFAMRVAGGASFGALPGPAGGLRGAGAVLGRGWRAELTGDYWLPRSRVIDDVGGTISLWTVGARGCWAPQVGERFEFPLCGGGEAGLMRGDPAGSRVVAGQTSRRPWVGLLATGGASWAIRRFVAVGLRAELSVPLLRTGFVVGDVQVHRAASVGGRIMAGVEARFP